MPLVVLLIGTSSAGKTTLASQLQERWPEHVLRFGIDDAFRMVAPRWGGGLDGPLSRDGFWYDRDPAAGITVVRYGATGRAVLAGMHDAVAAFARAGNNVVADEMLLDEAVLRDWARALADLPAYLVRVAADPAETEAREVRRGQVRGLARGHRAVNAIAHHDLLLDTTAGGPERAAETLVAWLAARPAPAALARYRRDFDLD